MNQDKKNQMYLALAMILFVTIMFSCIDGNSFGAIAFKVTANGISCLLAGWYIGWLMFDHNNGQEDEVRD